jgi:myosin-1
MRKSADMLVTKLKSCIPSYVRCIKPNENKRAHDFDEKRVEHQIKYLGLLENVRVRRAGFAYRGEFERFLRRFKIAHKDMRRYQGDARTGCQYLMQYLGFDESQYRIGKTMIFIKEPEDLFGLEDLRERTYNHYAGRIQRWYRLNNPAFLQIYREQCYWWDMMVYTFQNVLSDPDYGKNIQWPEYQEHLNEHVTWTYKIWQNWQAYRKISSMSPQQQANMRFTIRASGIFGGKKPYNHWRERRGDYLESENNWSTGKSACLQKHSDTRVLFADHIVKVNNVGRKQDRALVLTEKHIYNLDANKKFKLKKFYNLSSLTKVSLSPNGDTYAVLHFREPERDLVFDLAAGVGSDNKTVEFITLLMDALAELGQDMNLQISQPIIYNSSRLPKKTGKDVTLSFAPLAEQKDDKSSVFEMKCSTTQRSGRAHV